MFQILIMQEEGQFCQEKFQGGAVSQGSVDKLDPNPQEKYGILEFKKTFKKGEPLKIKSKTKMGEHLTINQKLLNDSLFNLEEDSSKKYIIAVEYAGTNDKKVEEILRTNRPWPSNQIFNYQEINIHHLQVEDTTLWIGIASISRKETSASKFVIPGTAPNSVGLKVLAASGKAEVHQNGQRIFDSEQDEGFQKIKSFGKEDYLGCGYCPHKNMVFFTYNGQKLTIKIKLHYKKNDDQGEIPQYYPVIAFKSKGILKLDIIFQNAAEKFKFDYKDEYASLKNRLIKRQILDDTPPCALRGTINPNPDIKNSQYSLVRNYLKFYGFDKTAEKMECQMKNRNMKFKSVNRPVKDREKYEKKFQQHRQQLRELEEKQKKIKKDNKRKKRKIMRSDLVSQINEIEYSSISSSQISQQSSSCKSDQYIYQAFMERGDLLPQEIRSSKKKIELPNEAKQRAKLQKRQRAQRVHRQLNHKCQQRIQDLKKNEERLFNNERIQILRCLRQGKHQTSLKILETKFPKIIETDPYLRVYFKALTFMKSCSEGNTSGGFEFLQKEQTLFEEFQNCLFPFYKQGQNGQVITEVKPLRQILLLLCPDHAAKFSLQKQLEVFGEFLGRLICQRMGFIGSSDLQIMFEHFRVVKDKIQTLGIPVGGLKLQ